MINNSQATPVQSIRDSSFHFVFEEIGFMAGSTDYQLATMKVNLTQLEEGSLAHTKVIEVQRQTVREFGLYNTSRGASHALYPSKQRLEESLSIHLQDADILHNRIQHLRQVLPQVELSRPGRILADKSNISPRRNKRFSEDHTCINHRQKRFLIPFIWGIIGTYKGILNEQKYEKLSKSLDKTNGQLAKVIDIVNNHETNLKAIHGDLTRIEHTINEQSILNSLNIETNLRSSHFRLSAEVNRISGALQAAQYRRLSIDFLSPNQLKELYEKMILAAEKSSSELLLSQPSDLLQLELSYFFDGEIITFLLHVPTVPFGAMLKLVKLHPFPLPLTGQYSIIPDVENQLLAISESDIPMFLQFPSINLLGCNQASHIYLCEKLGALDKAANQTCLGALHMQDFEVAKVLCPMKIVASDEISFRLNNNHHLVYTPIDQTITIKCPTGTENPKNEFIHLQEGVNQFQLAPGCRTALRYHYLFADNSISSDSGFKHITLRGESMLDIPQVNPDSLRNIMAYMKEEGLHNPTVNDIIETHDHLVTMNSRTSLISSIIAWTTFGLILSLIIISIFYLYSHLSDYLHIFFQILNLKTHQSLKELLPNMVQNIKDSTLTHIQNLTNTNPPPNNLQTPLTIYKPLINPFQKQRRDIVKYHQLQTIIN